MHRLSLAFTCVLVAAPAGASEVYRCSGTDGVSFQDKPCPGSMTQSVVHLDDAAPMPPPEPAPEAPPTASVEAQAPPPAPAVPVHPPPTFYLCVAVDGSRYISEDGVGRRSKVPYAMISGSRQTLAQAYGGPNGIGVSAPELQNRPTVPAREDPLGASYVWIVDECHHAAADEACAYLHGELDKVAGKLRRSFSDTEAQLKQEQAALRERMSGCSGM